MTTITITADHLRALRDSGAQEPVLALWRDEVTVLAAVYVKDDTYEGAEPILTRTTMYDWIDQGQGIEDMLDFALAELNADLPRFMADARRDLAMPPLDDD